MPTTKKKVKDSDFTNKLDRKQSNKKERQEGRLMENRSEWDKGFRGYKGVIIITSNPLKEESWAHKLFMNAKKDGIISPNVTWES